MLRQVEGGASASGIASTTCCSLRYLMRRPPPSRISCEQAGNHTFPRRASEYRLPPGGWLENERRNEGGAKEEVRKPVDSAPVCADHPSSTKTRSQEDAMAVQVPTSEQMRNVATRCGLSLNDTDLEAFRQLFTGYVAAYNAVDAMPDEVPAVRYPRRPGYRPGPEENRHNAWYRKTSVKGAPSGKLKGKRVAVKDNIMLAGVPMMNGASTLEGYVPDFDATVVSRILDEGGEIIGKTHCEYFCLSGGSHTNATGPVHNPHRMGYSAGGSSSGSAVVVALGEADMAMGGDQGGSIRMPASFSGICGMKPTWGLVPYTGIMPIEIFVDHTGPMTATVADNALLLEVVAGDDGYDPRIKAPKVHPYTRMLGGGVSGMRIALVTEGFRQPNGEKAVSEKVTAAARRLTAAYDAVLASHDLLVMPTTPMKATPLPGPGASREEYIQRALEMIGNTAPFDVTHHPAMSVPCGKVDGLPVGMMLVGKHFDEPTIYRAAEAFEKSGDWKTM